MSKYIFIFLLIIPQYCLAESSTVCYKKNNDIANKYYEEKKIEESIVFYKRANVCAKSKRQKISSLASLSTAYLTNENIIKSKIFLEKLQNLSPDNKWAKNFIKNNKIKLLQHNIQKSKSSSPSSRILGNDDLDTAVVYDDGVLYFKLDKFKRAISYPQKIYLDGILTSEVVRNFKNLVKENNIKEANIYLNSIGGELVAGIALGNFIRLNGFSTVVGKKSKNKQSTMDGECHSSCVFTFAGGTFRYVSDKDKLGIHRFSKTKASNDDLDQAQMVSALLTNYLKKMGVDIALFEKMAFVPPNKIEILSKKEAIKLRLANNGFLATTWTYQDIGTGIYLKGQQESWHGIGKLMFFCTPPNKTYVTIYQSKASEEIPHSISITIDGEEFPIKTTVEPVKSYITAGFSLNKNLFKKILLASKVGVKFRVANPDLYLGFELDIKNNNEKYKKYIERCISYSKN